MRYGYYGRKNSDVILAVLLGIFLFAGSISANTDDEREADRERFRGAIEERRDIFRGRVRGITSDRAWREAEVSAAGEDGFFRRVWDRIAKSRDEFNRNIFERRDIFAGNRGGESVDHPEGFFPRMAEKFKTAFVRRDR